MNLYRCHGAPPYRVALVHGGPGARGELSPVAASLSTAAGTLEIINSKATVRGEVNELSQALDQETDGPVVLVGHSWGAWLSILFAAGNPERVRKVILIGCPPFAPDRAKSVASTRLERMDEATRAAYRTLERALEDHEAVGKQDAFARLARLITRVDAFDPIPDALDIVDVTEFRVDVFQSVWPEAQRLRRSGKLIETLQKIECPVIAIHGDYDPHPCDDIQSVVESLGTQSRFILLERCGHAPWIERHARERFYQCLRIELR